MQHHAVIGRVGVVPVTIPVRREDMYLHIGRPHDAPYAQLGIEEVRACIHIMQTHVHHLHLPTVGGRLREGHKRLAEPYIMQEQFGHGSQLNG